MPELRLDNLTGFLLYLAGQCRTGDETQRQAAVDMLIGTVEGLPTEGVTIDDALTLHGLALSYAIGIANLAHDPLRVGTMARHLQCVLRSSASALEDLTGHKIESRMFFEETGPATVQ